MTDRLDELAGRLDRELSTLYWAEAARIRRRGTRRRIRAVAGATLAVVMLLGSAWTLLPPPVEPRTEFQGDDIPIEAMLQPSDVGPDFEIDNAHTYLAGEYPTWQFAQDDLCPRYASLNIDAYRTYLFMRGQIVARKGDDEGHTYVFTEARRFPGEVARQVMTDVTRTVSACAVYRTTTEYSSPTRPAEAERSASVIDRNFAGEESLMVRTQIDHRETATGEVFDRQVVLAAVVRVADLVAVTSFYVEDPQRLRELAKHTASRLCVATTAC
ncbi:hypothetical protein ACQEVC_32135 [Plantactinospora sp. CA-294935]|uniref:hypothetical protein n=1 Tax=Plantactinospora sp. CA-294935 TaxID=3240012 RepID=UPI003D8CAC11